MRKLGILGLGHMGMAIAKGAAGTIGKDAVAGYDPSSEKRTAGEALGIEIADSVSALCRTAHIVLVAVRPQDIEGLLNELKTAHPQCLLTIAAGIPIRRYTDALGPLPVIRAMPNTPLQLGEGAVALCRNELCSEEDFRFAIELFRSMGTACEISEDHMCDIIAVNGSSPAFIYLFAKGFIDYAASVGIDSAAATELFTQSLRFFNGFLAVAGGRHNNIVGPVKDGRVGMFDATGFPSAHRVCRDELDIFSQYLL